MMRTIGLLCLVALAVSCSYREDPDPDAAADVSKDPATGIPRDAVDDVAADSAPVDAAEVDLEVAEEDIDDSELVDAAEVDLEVPEEDIDDSDPGDVAEVDPEVAEDDIRAECTYRSCPCTSPQDAVCCDDNNTVYECYTGIWGRVHDAGCTRAGPDLPWCPWLHRIDR